MNLAELKSLEELQGPSLQPARHRMADDPLVRAWQTAKRITLTFLLAGSFISYYLIDKMLRATVLY